MLAHLYARARDGHTTLGPGSDFAELLDALAHLGAGQTHLHELRALLIRTATDDGTGLLALLGPTTRLSMAAALADPALADDELLGGLRTAVADVNAQVGSLPFARLQLLLAPVTESCQRLLASGVPKPLLPGLHTIAAQAYTLAGRLAFETRDDHASRALYAAATNAAGLLEDRWRRAVVHMSHALVTLYSPPGLDAARALVDAAVREARRGDSIPVRARAHALQAEIAARSDAERHAQTALSLAWYDLDRAVDSDPSPTSFSADHLRGFEGLCELYVGDAAAAHDSFARSAKALGAPRERVQRAIVSTDQALACIRLDAPERAAELLHGCIDSAASTGGRVPALRLRQARKKLRPWRREEFVAELDDHLIDALGS
ncbi:hypothetical protein EEJ42_01925 [Streptomyces botrytidirepellens]|uniref:Transcriptional regulator n=1 Tax=Streptomyces botrytidirepellens TaxID=2486417 RepID=A0A3M8X8T7_9ACTN|nr:hypothetical protein EEJ42_01925 [Streptomyces botrytidirepellens]